MIELRERGKLTFQWIPEHVERLLDLGCSAGHDTCWFSRKAGTAYGLDYSQEAIEEAQRHYPDLKFVQGSAISLPFEDNYFDVVTFIEVLEHLPLRDEVPAIKEIHRVLKPGGILIFSTPHKGLFYFLDPLDAKFKLYRLQKMLTGTKKYDDAFAGFYGGLKGHKHYTLSEVKKLLAGGFQIEHIYRNSLLLHPLSTWLFLISKKIGLKSRTLERVLQLISDFDFSCRYGIFSFNMHLLARKTGAANENIDVGNDVV
jgi:SAM-dependent methyltransferase